MNVATLVDGTSTVAGCPDVRAPRPRESASLAAPHGTLNTCSLLSVTQLIAIVMIEDVLNRVVRRLEVNVVGHQAERVYRRLLRHLHAVLRSAAEGEIGLEDVEWSAKLTIKIDYLT